MLVKYQWYVSGTILGAEDTVPHIKRQVNEWRRKEDWREIGLNEREERTITVLKAHIF